MFEYTYLDWLKWFFESITCWILGKLAEIDVWPLSEVDFYSWITVDGQPPPWWVRYQFPETWYDNLLPGNHPNHTLCYLYVRMVWRMLRDEIGHSIWYGISESLTLVHDFTGWIERGFSTFQGWINDIDWRVDTWLPSWAWSVAWGLSMLFDWLPSPITGGQDWLTWINLHAIQPLQDWVHSIYDAFATLAQSAFDWVVSKGVTLFDWYLSVVDWLNTLITSPFETILEWLGVAWWVWQAFWESPVEFICALWGIDPYQVYDLMDHPILWLTDKVTQEINQGSTTLANALLVLAGKILEVLWL